MLPWNLDLNLDNLQMRYLRKMSFFMVKSQKKKIKKQIIEEEKAN